MCRVAVYTLSRPLTVERRASISNQTPLCPTNSGMSTRASQKSEGEGGTCTGVRVIEVRNKPLMSPVQAGYTRGYISARPVPGATYVASHQLSAK